MGTMGRITIVIVVIVNIDTTTVNTDSPSSTAASRHNTGSPSSTGGHDHARWSVAITYAILRWFGIRQQLFSGHS